MSCRSPISSQDLNEGCCKLFCICIRLVFIFHLFFFCLLRCFDPSQSLLPPLFCYLTSPFSPFLFLWFLPLLLLSYSVTIRAWLWLFSHTKGDKLFETLNHINDHVNYICDNSKCESREKQFKQPLNIVEITF